MHFLVVFRIMNH